LSQHRLWQAAAERDLATLKLTLFADTLLDQGRSPRSRRPSRHTRRHSRSRLSSWRWPGDRRRSGHLSLG